MTASCCGDALLQQRQGHWSELMGGWMELNTGQTWKKNIFFFQRTLGRDRGSPSSRKSTLKHAHHINAPVKPGIPRLRNMKREVQPFRRICLNTLEIKYMFSDCFCKSLWKCNVTRLGEFYGRITHRFLIKEIPWKEYLNLSKKKRKKKDLFNSFDWLPLTSTNRE